MPDRSQAPSNPNEELWQAIERVLSSRMTEPELHALRELTGGGNAAIRQPQLPFQFDPDSGRFEIGDAWLVDLTEWEDLGAALPAGSPLMEVLGQSAVDSAVDLLCRACDILSEHQSELDIDLFRRPDEGGTFTFTFRFALGEDRRDTAGRDEATGRLFESLLTDAIKSGGSSAGWQVETENRGSERLVMVTVKYRSEQEFGAQRDHVYWLLDLAERQRHNRPFEARRVWQ